MKWIAGELRSSLAGPTRSAHSVDPFLYHFSSNEAISSPEISGTVYALEKGNSQFPQVISRSSTPTSSINYKKYIFSTVAFSVSSSDDIFTISFSEGVPTASSPQSVMVSSASSHEIAAAAYAVQGGFDIAVSDNPLPPRSSR